jgi:ABC-type nickel/cobalt efflux system permease component RcnA
MWNLALLSTGFGFVAMGVLDSLEPGHGKSLVMTFFSRQQTRWGHLLVFAIALGSVHLIVNGSIAWLVSKQGLLASHQALLTQSIMLLAAFLTFVTGAFLLKESLRPQQEEGADDHRCQSKRWWRSLSKRFFHKKENETAASSSSSWVEAAFLGGLCGLMPCKIMLGLLLGGGGNLFPHFWTAPLLFSTGYALTALLVGTVASLGVAQGLQQHWLSETSVLRLRQGGAILTMGFSLLLLWQTLQPQSLWLH